MIKELVLLPRMAYCGLFMLIGGVNAPLGGGALVLSFLFLFVLSFVWQYYVLHGALRTQNNRGRLFTLGVWLVLSFSLGSWGLYSLENGACPPDVSAHVQECTWQLALYLTGVSMFIAGACSRRAFARHRSF